MLHSHVGLAGYDAIFCSLFFAYIVILLPHCRHFRKTGPTPTRLRICPNISTPNRFRRLVHFALPAPPSLRGEKILARRRPNLPPCRTVTTSRDGLCETTDREGNSKCRRGNFPVSCVVVVGHLLNSPRAKVPDT